MKDSDVYRAEILFTEGLRDRERCKLVLLRGKPNSGADQRIALAQIELIEWRLRHLTKSLYEAIDLEQLDARFAK